MSKGTGILLLAIGSWAVVSLIIEVIQTIVVVLAKVPMP